MRIGIDLIAVQSPWSRLRGIGRLGHNLIAALLRHDRESEFFLYAYDGLPTDRIPTAPNARIVPIGQDSSQPDIALFDVIDRLARTNPDGLDVLLLLSPMEIFNRFGPPPKPSNGLRLASVVHDVIPFLFQENYLTEEYFAAYIYRNLETLRQYDVLLSNSDATRADYLRLLGMPAHRVVTIGCSSEEGCFRPDRSIPIPEATLALLRQLGISKPFIFNLGGMDEQNDRKNLFGLIEAFRLLPAQLRLSHQLVLSCLMNDTFMERMRRFADERGVGKQLVLTNEVPDATLRVLYQRCAVFAFPSFYEGFGLPILEAMQCGSPVVAGNNSSQVEVVGDAGLLANVHDAADIASKLARVLSNPVLAREMSQRSLEQSRRFSWEKTAGRALDALKRDARHAPGSRVRADRPHLPRPRIALFSPFAPKGSGISDYATRLVERLKANYKVDLYHDADYIPDLGLGAAEFGCFDYRLFDRRAALLNYHAIIYQMGNSVYHRFVYDTLLRHPGIVTLHDFCLSAFQYWYAHLPETAPGHFEREIENFCPSRASEMIALLPEMARERGGVQVSCARRGLFLNRRVFERSDAVVVHASWCLEQVKTLFPEHACGTAVIPMGATTRVVTAEEKSAIRTRFGLPAEALILASFGILALGKMNNEAIDAFVALAQENPSALLLFVGQDWEQGEAKRKAEELGIEKRVRFLGRQQAADFADLIAATDIGIALRRPPTDGETSASLLDLLRSGVATIVTDVATFSSYPDSVVRKVSWTSEGLSGLRRAIVELAADPRKRAVLGEAARAYVAEHHDWSRSTALYEELIERCHATRARLGGTPRSIITGPRRQTAPVGAVPASLP